MNKNKVWKDSAAALYSKQIFPWLEVGLKIFFDVGLREFTVIIDGGLSKARRIEIITINVFTLRETKHQKLFL